MRENAKSSRTRKGTRCSLKLWKTLSVMLAGTWVVECRSDRSALWQRFEWDQNWKVQPLKSKMSFQQRPTFKNSSWNFIWKDWPFSAFLAKVSANEKSVRRNESGEKKSSYLNLVFESLILDYLSILISHAIFYLPKSILLWLTRVCLSPCIHVSKI